MSNKTIWAPVNRFTLPATVVVVEDVVVLLEVVEVLEVLVELEVEVDEALVVVGVFGLTPSNA